MGILGVARAFLLCSGGVSLGPDGLSYRYAQLAHKELCCVQYNVTQRCDQYLKRCIRHAIHPKHVSLYIALRCKDTSRIQEKSLFRACAVSFTAKSSEGQGISQGWDDQGNFFRYCHGAQVIYEQRRHQAACWKQPLRLRTCILLGNVFICIIQSAAFSLGEWFLTAAYKFERDC